MKLNFLKSKSIIFVYGICCVLFFQNCSQSTKNASNTETSEVVSQNTNSQFDSVSDSNQQNSSSIVDEESCFRDYFSVYENPNNEDSMNHLKFLKSIKIYNSQFPSVSVGEQSFTISSSLVKSASGSIQVSTKFLKKEATSSDYLTCYFAEGNPIAEFRNMGLDQNMNILVGFLNSKSKFIRCYIESGEHKVLFQSADGNDFILVNSTPFVLKRGCRSY